MHPTSPELHDLALLSDGRGAALVSSSGAIEWCCQPRFDRGSTFGRLLDPGAGVCAVLLDGEERCGTAQYRPSSTNHLAVIDAPGGQFEVEDALVPGADPPRLARLVRCAKGRGAVTVRIAPRFDYGAVRPWIRRVDGHTAYMTGGDDAIIICAAQTLTRDGDHDVLLRATLRAGEQIALSMAFVAPENAHHVAASMTCTAEADLDAAAAHVAATLANVDAAAREDPQIERSVITLLSLVYEPTGAIIAAPTTSLPETADGNRTWDYRLSWIRDATLASRALARLGLPEIGDAFSAFAMRSTAGAAADMQVVYGAGGERRLDVHELDLRGWRGAKPVRVGNGAAAQVQRDEPGEILQQCRDRHVRGYRFDDDEWRYLVRLADHVVATWDRPGHGFWERPGPPQHHVYGLASSVAALDSAITIAQHRRVPIPARWSAARAAAAERALRDGYDEQLGSFVGIIGSAQVDAVALLIPQSGLVGWDDPRMRRTARVIAERLQDGGLLRRYQASDGLAGHEGCFIACTFWLAECLARQGAVDDASRWFQRAVGTASPLGLFSEEWDPVGGRPLGNYPQALTHVAHVSAALALREAQGTRR